MIFFLVLCDKRKNNQFAQFQFLLVCPAFKNVSRMNDVQVEGDVGQRCLGQAKHEIGFYMERIAGIGMQRNMHI